MQGNGHEHDFAGDNRVYIFDMFNYQIYPSDFVAKSMLIVLFYSLSVSKLYASSRTRVQLFCIFSKFSVLIAISDHPFISALL